MPTTDPTTAPVDLHGLIRAAQTAVRAVEDSPSPQSLAALDGALCLLPVHPLDAYAEVSLHRAMRAVALAEDAEEWGLLADAEREVAALRETREHIGIEHPAVTTVSSLGLTCAERLKAPAGDPAEAKRWKRSPERRAWDRGNHFSLEVLRHLPVFEGGRHAADNPPLDRAMDGFRTAVRRAIAYQALYLTREALTAAAASYRLFVIGMRQPLPEGRWDWSRRIGTATYMFEVVPPLAIEAMFPYGSVAVVRIGEDGTRGDVRYAPLGDDENRRTAVTEALFRI
ncbi:hypothetical protein [Streptomyces sp. NPDC097619]|uniref:hypothetical protein n=1 Tax=Streptomyces sp. NPDC097619 TaxID=3157228 RepID=UPI00333100A0